VGPATQDQANLTRGPRRRVTGVVALPLALAFGVASGLGPVAGLYGAIATGIIAALFGGTPVQIPEPYRAASPLTYVSAKAPPTLLLYGRRDHIVEARFGRILNDRLRAAGATSILLELPWSEHAFDLVPSGLGGQVSLYYTERFLAWALTRRVSGGRTLTAEG